MILPDLASVTTTASYDFEADPVDAGVCGREQVKIVSTADGRGVPWRSGNDFIPEIAWIPEIVLGETPGIFPNHRDPHLVVEEPAEQELVGRPLVRLAAIDGAPSGTLDRPDGRMTANGGVGGPGGMAGQDVTARQPNPVTDCFRSFLEWSQAACAVRLCQAWGSITFRIAEHFRESEAQCVMSLNLDR